MYHKTPTIKELTKFLNTLTKLDPVKFIGVATILGVDCFEDEERKTPKLAEQVMGEMYDAFVSLTRKKRRVLLRQMIDAADAMSSAAPIKTAAAASVNDKAAVQESK